MEIVHLDPFKTEPSVWERLHAYRRARQAEIGPDEPLLSDADFEAQARNPNPHVRRKQWLALDRDGVIGSLMVFESTAEDPRYADNRRFVWAGCGVLRGRRRAGVARQFLDILHRTMCENGSEIAHANCHEPDGQAFMHHIGAVPRLTMVDNRLALGTVDWAALAHRKQQIVAGNPDLTMETYVNRVPFEVQEAMIPELTALIDDVPVGDLNVPPAGISMAEIREYYRQLDRHGGAQHLVVLRTPDGRLAGVADVNWDARLPGIAYHSFTGVRRDMRGRGLAAALKIVALEVVRSQHPSVTQMRTRNAASNAAMLAVNVKLGFVAHRTDAVYQVEREALGAVVEAKRAA